MSFQSLGLSKSILNELDNQGFKSPTPIQAKAIPSILNYKDVLGIAKTGSGKTASFVLPILMNLQGVKIVKNRHINVLVITPTRELAIQVNDVFKQFVGTMPDQLKTMAVYGGVSINTQMIELQNTNILVATPGRLIDLIEHNAVHLSNVETLVIDEADKMLDLGFKEEIDKILGLLPEKRQNLLFSATLNDNIDEIKSILLKNPEVINIQSENNESNLELIQQTGYFVKDEKKGPLLRHLIKSNNYQQVLIFCSTLYKADNVADKLRKNGIPAQAIHRKKSQTARQNALKIFKAGQLRVLVATDILSRGIDINELEVVINYELPRSPKEFIHRIGRTGRANKNGVALTFVTENDKHHFKVIQKKMKKWVTMVDTENIDF